MDKKILKVKIFLNLFGTYKEVRQVADISTTDIAIYVDDTTLYPKCDQVSDLWQQLDLASELESDLRDTVDWGRK